MTMGGIINNNELAIITQPTTVHFHLPKDFKNSLKHEVDFIKVTINS